MAVAVSVPGAAQAAVRALSGVPAGQVPPQEPAAGGDAARPGGPASGGWVPPPAGSPLVGGRLSGGRQPYRPEAARGAAPPGPAGRLPLTQTREPSAPGFLHGGGGSLRGAIAVL